MNIYEKDDLRRKILHAIYNVTDGNSNNEAKFTELGLPGSNLDKNNRDAINYLVNDGLIKGFSGGIIVGLTHQGVIFVESFLRKIDFSDDVPFNSTELYQLKIMLEEIKNDLIYLKAAPDILLERIDASIIEAQSLNKITWKENMLNQLNDWSSQQAINITAQIIINALLHGLKLSAS